MLGFNLPVSPQYIVPPLVLAIIATLLMAFDMRDTLEFHRQLITDGQVWRIWSSQYIHTNWTHLGLNLVGILFIWVLHAEHTSIKRYFAHVLLLGLWTGLGIWLFCPDIRVYTGLSGLLHGIIVWGALKDIQVKEPTGILLFLGIVGKLAWEQYAGPSTDVGNLIDSRVAIESHLIGALGGLVLAIPLFTQSLGLNKSETK
ncbi:rhombosortase [Pseudoalteromonas umbrosa]|uniref:rhombosortase n=1 Tax=Pseudoalteromonas umbrosa TaxID=3048489 RepID=UPI0024C37C22|nr:rhombosortase [Pseudoalteromonas sp. B95]MDK1286394.1 rhombosortase [Pseudoalteromonas sp. B95]